MVRIESIQDVKSLLKAVSNSIEKKIRCIRNLNGIVKQISRLQVNIMVN